MSGRDAVTLAVEVMTKLARSAYIIRNVAGESEPDLVDDENLRPFWATDTYDHIADMIAPALAAAYRAGAEAMREQAAATANEYAIALMWGHIAEAIATLPVEAPRGAEA